MTVRLLVVAAAATVGTRDLVFGATDEVRHPEHIAALPGRSVAWVCGPEPACGVTARRLGGAPTVVPELRGPGFGRWHGRTLTEVGGAEPEAVRTWLTDVDAAPHGGESLADLLARIGEWADAEPWPDGRTVATVTPLVARALAVHGLGAPARTLLRIEVAPLDQVALTRAGAQWRLRLS